MSRFLTFVRSRVSRRVLALFVVGAVVPVLVMAVLSYRAVRGQLLEQSRERLERLAETAGQSIVQRLLVVEQGLVRVGDEVAAGREPADRGLLPVEVDALGIQEADGSWRTLAGTFGMTPGPLSPEQAKWVRGGRTALTVLSRDPTRVAAVRAAPSDGGAPPRLIWAGLVGDSIWGAAQVFSTLPEVAGFCVVDARGPLTCTGQGRAFASAVDPERDRRGTRQVSMSDGAYVVGFRQFFLAAAFASPPWAVLVAESEHGVYAPAHSFAFSFLLALAVGVLTVILLANTEVRRTLGPLRALEEGTRRIARGEFATRVTPRSSDEFGFLADSFNRMADELGTQFRQLEATAAIGERALASEGPEPVVEEILQRFIAVTQARTAAILLLPTQTNDSAVLWWRRAGGPVRSRQVDVSDGDHRWLSGEPAHGSPPPPFLGSWRQASGPDRVRSLPLLNRDRVWGAILYETADGGPWTGGTLERARHVADQAALALHEIQLLAELDDMSLGTMRALARAIDAKSRWTAGHSERVTEVSLGLAGALGLPQEDMVLLQRGGLLHDIGKIGIPSRVLDTVGPLSDPDWELIKTHPVVGARILEPIGPFGPILPIVLQHHERWDGTGYPEGLGGLDIHPLARIVSVADAFDAITSERPYQDPVSPAVAVGEIIRNAGTQFSPEAVEAFVAYMASQGVHPVSRTEATA